MQFTLFFKRKSDNSDVKSLKIINPTNLDKDQSASIFRIESNTKTEFSVEACHWFNGGYHGLSTTFGCQQKTFPTEKEATRFVSKFYKKPIRETESKLDHGPEIVGQKVENFNYPTWLDLEFDHKKIMK